MSHIDEIRDLFDHMEQAWRQGEPTTLLTITQVKGSAYRQPGAKMMMAKSGKMHGTLSGGCLESDLYGWAVDVMDNGEARVIHYDLSENELWSLGIGCKGNMDIAVFPVTPDDPFWAAVRRAVTREETISLAMEIPVGARVLFAGNERIDADGPELPPEVEKQLLARAATRTRAEVVAAGERRFYVDSMRPNERLVICGAGHDAVPVAALASKSGFRVTVLDPRAAFNRDARFPAAEHLIAEPDAIDPAALSDSWWLVMNHLQLRDEAALRLALHADAKFIGVLGPVSRTEEMLTHIKATLDSGPIHAPVGLDVGAETIDEVAVSLVAELLAVRSHSSGHSLHGREKIHV